MLSMWSGAFARPNPETKIKFQFMICDVFSSNELFVKKRVYEFGYDFLVSVKIKVGKTRPLYFLKLYVSTTQVQLSSVLSVLYSLAHTADDDSWIYVVETFSFRGYCGLYFPP